MTQTTSSDSNVLLHLDEQIPNMEQECDLVDDESYSTENLQETIQNVSQNKADELIQGNKILREIMNDSNKSLTWPFQDAVDASVAGLEDYFDKIKSPMWLNKMWEKFDQGQYNTINEFIVDFRTMIQNCYRYNGVNHMISKKAQRLELIFNQKLALLPRTLREKATLPVMATDSAPDYNGSFYRRRIRAGLPLDSSDFFNQMRFEESQRGREMRRQQICERKAQLEASHQQALGWEKDLLTEPVLTQMTSMWEIPQISLFLILCRAPLNLGEVVHYEVERAFIMPRESSMMKLMMTSLLSTTHQRSSIDRRPLLPYKVWEFRLRQRLSFWYKTFADCNLDTFKTSYKLGIQEEFFFIVGLTNPLDRQHFHELSLYRRVWIVKSLCENCVENQESLRLAIENQPESDQKEYVLGQDENGDVYIHFPQFCGSDLRVYKHKPYKDFEFTHRNYFAEKGNSDSVEMDDVESVSTELSASSLPKSTQVLDGGDSTSETSASGTDSQSTEFIPDYLYCPQRLTRSSFKRLDKAAKLSKDLLTRTLQKSATQMKIEKNRDAETFCGLAVNSDIDSESMSSEHFNDTDAHDHVTCPAPEQFDEASLEDKSSVHSDLTTDVDSGFKCNENILQDALNDIDGDDGKDKELLTKFERNEAVSDITDSSTDGSSTGGFSMKHNVTNAVVDNESDLSNERSSYNINDCDLLDISKATANNDEIIFGRDDINKDDSELAGSCTKDDLELPEDVKPFVSNKIDEEKNALIPELGNFELVANKVEDLRQLVLKFSDAETPAKKLKKGRGHSRKRCVIDLHQRLEFLLRELEPWEVRLEKATKMSRLKLFKEKENYKESENDVDSVLVEGSCDEDEPVSSSIAPPCSQKQNDDGVVGQEARSLGNDDPPDVSARGRLRKRRFISSFTELNSKRRRTNKIAAETSQFSANWNQDLPTNINSPISQSEAITNQHSTQSSAPYPVIQKHLTSSASSLLFDKKGCEKDMNSQVYSSNKRASSNNIALDILSQLSPTMIQQLLHRGTLKVQTSSSGPHPPQTIILNLNVAKPVVSSNHSQCTNIVPSSVCTGSQHNPGSSEQLNPRSVLNYSVKNSDNFINSDLYNNSRSVELNCSKPIPPETCVFDSSPLKTITRYPQSISVTSTNFMPSISSYNPRINFHSTVANVLPSPPRNVETRNLGMPVSGLSGLLELATLTKPKYSPMVTVKTLLENRAQKTSIVNEASCVVIPQTSHVTSPLPKVYNKSYFLNNSAVTCGAQLNQIVSHSCTSQQISTAFLTRSSPSMHSSFIAVKQLPNKNPLTELEAAKALTLLLDQDHKSNSISNNLTPTSSVINVAQTVCNIPQIDITGTSLIPSPSRSLSAARLTTTQINSMFVASQSQLNMSTNVVETPTACHASTLVNNATFTGYPLQQFLTQNGVRYGYRSQTGIILLNLSSNTDNSSVSSTISSLTSPHIRSRLDASKTINPVVCRGLNCQFSLPSMSCISNTRGLSVANTIVSPSTHLISTLPSNLHPGNNDGKAQPALMNASNIATINDNEISYSNYSLLSTSLEKTNKISQFSHNSNTNTNFTVHSSFQQGVIPANLNKSIISPVKITYDDNTSKFTSKPQDIKASCPIPSSANYVNVSYPPVLRNLTSLVLLNINGQHMGVVPLNSMVNTTLLSHQALTVPCVFPNQTKSSLSAPLSSGEKFVHTSTHMLSTTPHAANPTVQPRFALCLRTSSGQNEPTTYVPSRVLNNLCLSLSQNQTNAPIMIPDIQTPTKLVPSASPSSAISIPMLNLRNGNMAATKSDGCNSVITNISKSAVVSL